MRLGERPQVSWQSMTAGTKGADMIKVIVFDYGGVLVREKDIELTDVEDKLERFFGKNYSDEKYAKQVNKIEPNSAKALKTTKNIIDILYEIKDKDLFSRLNKKYPDIIFAIGTNHISYIEKHIKETLDIKHIDKIFVSAKMNKVKPHLNFYREIIKYYKLKPEEFLFVDDNQENVDGAIKAGMYAIKINRGDNVFKKVCEFLEG